MSRPFSGQRVVRGLLAGLVGTAALSVFERLERALLGRAPVYAASEIGCALIKRTGVPCSTARARQVGLLLRWLYGPTLGAVYAITQHPGGPRSRLRSGLRLSSAIYLFEMVAMPLTRATRPVRDWTATEVVLLFCHASAFGVTTAAAVRSK